MVDELEDLQGARRARLEELIAKMQSQRNGVLIGSSVLSRIGKKVGERVKISSFNYKEIELEFDVFVVEA